jgi:hypothetical protein
MFRVVLATELPTHESVLSLIESFSFLEILPLTTKDFLESRLETMYLLKDSPIILPVQEDFLLEARPMREKLEEAFYILKTDDNVASIRIMPCPGPSSSALFYKDSDYWKELKFTEGMVFTYQATLWKKEVYENFLKDLLTIRDTVYGWVQTDKQKKQFALTMNAAEQEVGQNVLYTLSRKYSYIHLSCLREGKQPNAVYLAPWPYRPTAVVKGKLESWAKELAVRESAYLDWDMYEL